MRGDGAATLAVSSDELAAEAGEPAQAAEAFLDAFSRSFGEIRGGRPLMSGRNEVRARPLVAHPTGGYIGVAASNLLWAIRPRLEQTLKRTPAWNPYGDRRAAYVESKVAELLAGVFGAEAVWQNVSFNIGRDTVPWEADVIARLDDVAFVVEVKSGELSPKARQGRRRELKRDLEDLLGKSSTQATRLADALHAGQPVRFYDRRTGEETGVVLDGIEEVEAVVVTLEDLTLVANDAATLRAAGIIAPDARPPWTVCVFDLEVICKSLEYAAQLTLYASQRRDLDGRIWFNDEQALWLTSCNTAWTSSASNCRKSS